MRFRLFSDLPSDASSARQVRSGGPVSHDGGEKWRRLMNISGLLTLALVPTRGWGADYGGGGPSPGQEVGISPLFTVKTGNGCFGSDPF